MKNCSHSLHLNIDNEIYAKLRNLAIARNQSMTRFLEDCILAREKLHKKNLAVVEEIKQINHSHIQTYNGLNASFSNLNQLTYNVNINNMPNSETIIDIVELVKECVLQDIELNKEIISTLDNLTNIKSRILRKRRKYNDKS